MFNFAAPSRDMCPDRAERHLGPDIFPLFLDLASALKAGSGREIRVIIQQLLLRRVERGLAGLFAIDCSKHRPCIFFLGYIDARLISPESVTEIERAMASQWRQGE
jgi:hypothetical protein